MSKYTKEEIEVFKLRARLRKLERDLSHEIIQGSLFPSMSEDTKNVLIYEIKRLKNRLVIMEHIVNG
jgi:hypothetical protein